jgi:hypothetical protein
VIHTPASDTAEEIAGRKYILSIIPTPAASDAFGESGTSAAVRFRKRRFE